jgi:hypothetical protein
VNSGRQRNKENNIKQSEWWEGENKNKTKKKREKEEVGREGQGDL